MWRLLPIIAAGLVAVAALAGSGYAGYWFLAAGAAESAIHDWMEAQQSQGFEATTEAVVVSGFPGNILIHLDQISVAAPNHALDWQWSGQAIDASIDLKNPRQIVMLIRGSQHLAYGIGAQRINTEIVGKRMTVQLDLRNDRGLESLSLDVGGATLTNAHGDTPITVARFQFRANLGAGGGLVPNGTQMSVRFDNLVLPAHTRGPLGNTLSLVQANLEMLGTLDNGDLAEALADWRDAQGAVRIQESQVRWGTLDLSGRGGFTLDDQFRPRGSIDALIRGYITTIDAFHAAGLLDDDERKSIDSVLRFLGQQGPLTNIGLPVRMGEGLIFVGPVSMGKIGPVLPLNQPPD
jgi:hypothetical protein